MSLRRRKKSPPKKLRTVVRFFARKLHARKRRNISSCTQKQPISFCPGGKGGKEGKEGTHPISLPTNSPTETAGLSSLSPQQQHQQRKAEEGFTVHIAAVFGKKKPALADFPFKDGKDHKLIQKNDAEPLYPPLPWQGAERRGRQGHPSPEGRAAFPRHDEVRAGES